MLLIVLAPDDISDDVYKFTTTKRYHLEPPTLLSQS